MYKVLAQMRLYPESEGGMTRDGFSGMRPSFGVAGELIMCEIFETSGERVMERGASHEVRIHLPYGEMFKERLPVGYQFKLNVGGKVIGEGVIKGILDEKG